MTPPSERSTVESRPKHAPFVVAVTGGIGSGKSTVARLLEKLGGRVIDADEIAREITAEEDVMRQLRESFGAAVFQDSGALDRAALARSVFADSDRLATLNRIVHPRVRARIDKELAKWAEKGFDRGSPLPDHRPLVVLDIPLLESSPFAQSVSSVIFVHAPLLDRVRRVTRHRGWTADDLRRREAHQADLSEKRASANHVIDNPDSAVAPEPGSTSQDQDDASGTQLGPADLHAQCLRLIESWRRLLREPQRPK